MSIRPQPIKPIQPIKRSPPIICPPEPFSLYSHHHLTPPSPCLPPSNPLGPANHPLAPPVSNSEFLVLHFSFCIPPSPKQHPRLLTPVSLLLAPCFAPPLRLSPPCSASPYSQAPLRIPHSALRTSTPPLTFHPNLPNQGELNPIKPKNKTPPHFELRIPHSAFLILHPPSPLRASPLPLEQIKPN
jgi:hypothetical protein